MSDRFEEIKALRKMFEVKFPQAVRAIRRAYSDSGDPKFKEMLDQIDNFGQVGAELMPDFVEAYEFWR